MASLTKIFSGTKLNGKIYTPDFIVAMILDDIGFSGVNCLEKTILDPACGDGRFLVQVAKRIIEYSPKQNLKHNLSVIYGWDTDADALSLCKSNLDKLLEDFDFSIAWNLQRCDSLLKISDVSSVRKFDYIVGNPPYIRIQHLDIEQRNYIQTNYNFCKSGSTDIYIAFFELSLKLLSDNGLCAFISPNTFFYTETAKPLRTEFVSKNNLLKITNFADIQVFENATTYSAITMFSKKSYESFVYRHAISLTDFEQLTFSFSELKDKKFWQLSTKPQKYGQGKKLKDICKIHVGITTLMDKAYIVSVLSADSKVVIAETKLRGSIKIEREILKPIIKASILKNANEPILTYVIFPFRKQNGKHVILSESELSLQYPLAFEYLLSVKDELAKRDNGKPVTPWYNFGRSQGLETSFGKKILFSPMNKKPNFIVHNNEDATFYSGYCIKYFGDYQLLADNLNTKEMENYIQASARDFRGGWKAYNKKIVEEFEVEL